MTQTICFTLIPVVVTLKKLMLLINLWWIALLELSCIFDATCVLLFIILFVFIAFFADIFCYEPANYKDLSTEKSTESPYVSENKKFFMFHIRAKWMGRKQMC